MVSNIFFENLSIMIYHDLSWLSWFGWIISYHLFSSCIDSNFQPDYCWLKFPFCLLLSIPVISIIAAPPKKDREAIYHWLSRILLLHCFCGFFLPICQLRWSLRELQVFSFLANLQLKSGIEIWIHQWILTSQFCYRCSISPYLNAHEPFFIEDKDSDLNVTKHLLTNISYRSTNELQ